MPLYKTITVNPSTKVLIWKIEESFEELCEGIYLTENSDRRVSKMKSILHKRGFMSIRHLLVLEGYKDRDLYYDENGKPYLTDQNYISITHSFNFSAIVISDVEVGIDVEKQRSKILRIAHKFTPVEEYRTIANEDALIRKLTLVWCAKESLYKSFSHPGLSFIHNIYVDDFRLTDAQTKARVRFAGKSEVYNICFLEFDEFSCAYALPQLK